MTTLELIQQELTSWKGKTLSSNEQFMEELEASFMIIAKMANLEGKEAIFYLTSELGKKSAESLTPEQRKERARKAVQTRWSKKRQVEQQETKVMHT